jgi:hypothetical protein
MGVGRPDAGHDPDGYRECGNCGSEDIADSGWCKDCKVTNNFRCPGCEQSKVDPGTELCGNCLVGYYHQFNPRLSHFDD